MGMKYVRIKELRKEKGVSQQEVASLLQTTQQHYSRIENGSTDITGDRLKLLASFYGTSIDYILELTDCRESYPNKINTE